MKAVAYNKEMAAEWDNAVAASRNGTFLHKRSFMDYHSDRFTDASLIFHNDKDETVGVMPANILSSEGCVSSHSGLTYGGIIMLPNTSLTDVREMLREAARVYRAAGITKLIYKPVPHIYHKYAADDDLYWLFRANASVVARGASASIRLDNDERKALWQRKTKKKACEELLMREVCDHLEGFWQIVEEVLAERHNTKPVHTIGEMKLLCERFPDNIKLYTATNPDGRVIAGSLLFITDMVAHVQYMEAGEEGRRRRALDWLIRQLIERYSDSGVRHFDFGISTENGGHFLNEGLAYQKEGFGGRTVCYDTYSVELEKLCDL